MRGCERCRAGEEDRHRHAEGDSTMSIEDELRSGEHGRFGERHPCFSTFDKLCHSAIDAGVISEFAAYGCSMPLDGPPRLMLHGKQVWPKEETP